MNPYEPLLLRYHALIDREPWWDGARIKLVAEMDLVWGRMTHQQRQDAEKVISVRQYQERINR